MYSACKFHNTSLSLGKKVVISATSYCTVTILTIRKHNSQMP